MQTLSLARFESIGYNCEFGFVLQLLGNSTPSLFRWSWINPEALVTVLDRDFDSFFLHENLRPYLTAMVKDVLSDVHFHSNMRSRISSEGAAVFTGTANYLSILYRAEARIVFRHLEKFRARLASPDVIYVIKQHDLLTESIVDRIILNIRRRAGTHSFTLLLVGPFDNSKAPGSIVKVGHSIYKAQLPSPAPDNDTRNLDLNTWTTILERVLQLRPTISEGVRDNEKPR